MDQHKKPPKNQMGGSRWVVCDGYNVPADMLYLLAVQNSSVWSTTGTGRDVALAVGGAAIYWISTGSCDRGGGVSSKGSTRGLIGQQHIVLHPRPTARTKRDASARDGRRLHDAPPHGRSTFSTCEHCCRIGIGGVPRAPAQGTDPRARPPGEWRRDVGPRSEAGFH